MLELNTNEVVRQSIKIDGYQYELNSSKDLKLKETLYLSRVGKQIQKAVDAEEYTEELGNKLENELDASVRLVLRESSDDEAPSITDVIAKLKDGQKIEIIRAFSGAEANEGAQTPS